MSNVLFEPINVGEMLLPSRIVMAPLTRSRAGVEGVPSAMNVEYYRQRASAALIITEATQISQQGQGYAWTPGIYSADQVAGWRSVADTVHAEGGKIFMQLWHVGRVSHQVFQPGGQLPVAPSAMQVPGKAFIAGEDGKGVWADIPVPQELDIPGIEAIIADYVRAARNAIEAGMDGIEIHAANGYLIDQFINSGSNLREDRYGGSVENRVRLLLEVVDRIAKAIGIRRVAVRLTPLGRLFGMSDDSPEETIKYIAAELNRRAIAYLHVVEPSTLGTELDVDADPLWDEIIWEIRDTFKGTLMLAGGYDAQSAQKALGSGRGDLIAFGKLFIANPDLPRRFIEGAPLNEPERATFFGGTDVGYVDYPSLETTGV
jgi:N-ethylmaleimide reductase